MYIAIYSGDNYIEDTLPECYAAVIKDQGTFVDPRDIEFYRSERITVSAEYVVTEYVPF